MYRRAASAVLRVALVLACVVTLLGHLCVPLQTAHAGNPTDPSVAEALGETSHAASCEALPGSSVRCPGSLAVDTRIPASAVRVTETGAAVDTPAPIPRPPRFLLHATLLN
ncbi:MAG TPA: hypothetical protein VGW35_03650 [Methylomirabilota bacterium]|nr:hypothetical protein [Methylomirabilota bacterium]HEV8676084.1 hypothetical protein [Methylomirabilota bacterium]